jgi:hypothetical protein
MVGRWHPSRALLLAWLLFPSAAAAGGPCPPCHLDDLWAELGTSDPARAEQVTAYLVARPGLALPLLRQRLKPVCRPEPLRLERLIADLDHSRFTIRERAFAELEYLGDAVEGDLRRARAGRLSAEARRRIDLLLARLRAHRFFPSSELLRRSRAVDVLERVGGPEAREVLAGLARGAPAVLLTVEAQAALDRLTGPAQP